MRSGPGKPYRNLGSIRTHEIQRELSPVIRSSGYPVVKARACLLILTGLAILTYLPVFTQPFIADDHGLMPPAREYGPISRWGSLASDPVHRYRPIFMVLTYWVGHLFGFQPVAFYVAFYSVGVLLHVLNTWLVFGLGVWQALG